MKKIIRYLFGTAILMVVAYSFFLIWQQSRPQSDMYNIHEVTKGEVRDEVTLSGELVARNETEIYPIASGTLQKLYVREGDKVKKGDLIAVISITPNPAEVASGDAAVSDAKIVADQQRSETVRARELYNNGIITLQELNHQEYLLRRAEDALSQARTSADVARSGNYSRSSRLTEVRSSTNGYILSLPVKEMSNVGGRTVGEAGTPIAKIGNTDDMIFRGMVDESQVAKIKPGQVVILEVAALPSKTVYAEIEEIAMDAQKVNGIKQYEVKAGIKADANLRNVLRSGFSAFATVTTSKVHNVLVAPESVVSYEGDETYVYELVSANDEGSQQEFRKRAVKLGLSNGLIVELKSGVKEGMCLRGTLKVK